VRYLCAAASRYLAQRVEPSQVLWRYAGVRPLYDDGSDDPSSVTRDYTLRVDDVEGAAPVLSVFGGKITTYRRLAEHALEKLAPYFPQMKPAWTGKTPLPGSVFESRAQARAQMFERYAELPEAVVRGAFRRHGAEAPAVLGDGRVGEHYGAGLTERELRHFLDHEWAASAEDVLWRRTKCGLHMSEAQRRRVEQVVGR
jgi:glycerol-3-phosphate dehydrogenase